MKNAHIKKEEEEEKEKNDGNKQYEEEDMKKGEKHGFILENEKFEFEKENKREDLMRKKMKTNCLSHLIKNMNKIIKSENIPRQFKKIPQCEAINVAIQENFKILNFTFKELLSYKAYEKISFKNKKDKDKEIEREIEREKAKETCEHNEQVLKVLEVTGKTNIDKILNMKMKDIYKEYLDSDEFQQSIEKLRRKGKNYDYIHDYLIIAKNVLKYYGVEP